MKHSYMVASAQLTILILMIVILSACGNNINTRKDLAEICKEKRITAEKVLNFNNKILKKTEKEEDVNLIQSINEKYAMLVDLYRQAEKSYLRGDPVQGDKYQKEAQQVLKEIGSLSNDLYSEDEVFQ